MTTSPCYSASWTPIVADKLGLTSLKPSSTTRWTTFDWRQYAVRGLNPRAACNDMIHSIHGRIPRNQVAGWSELSSDLEYKAIQARTWQASPCSNPCRRTKHMRGYLRRDRVATSAISARKSEVKRPCSKVRECGLDLASVIFNAVRLSEIKAHSASL